MGSHGSEPFNTGSSSSLIIFMANGIGSRIVNANVDVDEIIDQLLGWTITKERKDVHMKVKEIEYLCKRSAEIFLSEPCLLELEGPLTIAGRRSNGWTVG